MNTVAAAELCAAARDLAATAARLAVSAEVLERNMGYGDVASKIRGVSEDLKATAWELLHRAEVAQGAADA